jgi:hypothetical protein
VWRSVDDDLQAEVVVPLMPSSPTRLSHAPADVWTDERLRVTANPPIQPPLYDTSLDHHLYERDLWAEPHLVWQAPGEKRPLVTRVEAAAETQRRQIGTIAEGGVFLVTHGQHHRRQLQYGRNRDV